VESLGHHNSLVDSRWGIAGDRTIEQPQRVIARTDQWPWPKEGFGVSRGAAPLLSQLAACGGALGVPRGTFRKEVKARGTRALATAAPAAGCRRERRWGNSGVSGQFDASTAAFHRPLVGLARLGTACRRRLMRVYCRLGAVAWPCPMPCAMRRGRQLGEAGVRWPDRCPRVVAADGVGSA
jgi:hypothetical protein